MTNPKLPPGTTITASAGDTPSDPFELTPPLANRYSDPDLLLTALRELSTEALENADTFTASDFSGIMSALAENFRLLDAAMLRRNTPRDWRECDACEGHGGGCAWCQGSGLMRHHPTIETITDKVRVHSKARSEWGTITGISKAPDGTLQHRVDWDCGKRSGDWYDLGNEDQIENFVALNAAWSQYAERKEYTIDKKDSS